MAHGTESYLGHAASLARRGPGRPRQRAAALARALDRAMDHPRRHRRGLVAVLAEQNPPDGARLTTTWPRGVSVVLRPRTFAGPREPPGRAARLILTWPGALALGLFPTRPGPLHMPPHELHLHIHKPESSRTAMRGSARPGRRRPRL